MLLFDDAEKMSRAYHICEISAPSRVQPAGYAKRIVFHFIDARSGHHPAHLSLLPKRQQIGQNIEMFAAPITTRRTHAALHFVEDEQNVVFVANFSQFL